MPHMPWLLSVPSSSGQGLQRPEARCIDACLRRLSVPSSSGQGLQRSHGPSPAARLELSVPSSSGQGLQRRHVVEHRGAVLPFQSPRHRVKVCNRGTPWSRCRRPAPFQSPRHRVKVCNPAPPGRVDGRHDFQSPRHRVKVCNSRETFGWAPDLHFQSPRHRVKVCNATCGDLVDVGQIVFQSPRHRVKVCNWKGGDAHEGAGHLSVPSSSGQGLQLCRY